MIEVYREVCNYSYMISYDIILCYIILYYVMLCYVMLCCVMLLMLCYVTNIYIYIEV